MRTAHADTSSTTQPSIDANPIVRTAGETHAGLPETLDVYMQKLSFLEPLPPDRQTRLARAHKNGDRHAGQQLIATNLRLVVKLARDYSKSQHELLELIQEGGLGMVIALDRYDPDQGTKFTSYAQYWIRARILDYLINRGRCIRLGTSRAGRKIFYNLARARRSIETRGAEATTGALAEELDVTEENIVEVTAQMESSMVLLDTPLSDEEDQTIGDTIPAPGDSPAQQAEDRQIREIFQAALHEFREALTDPREVDILRDRILAEDPKTLRELGEIWGVSKERIRQIEVDLRDRLAVEFKARYLEVG